MSISYYFTKFIATNATGNHCVICQDSGSYLRSGSLDHAATFRAKTASRTYSSPGWTRLAADVVNAAMDLPCCLSVIPFRRLLIRHPVVVRLVPTTIIHVDP
jgi:hypothetical protein